MPIAETLSPVDGQRILRAYNEGPWTGQLVTALVMRGTKYALPSEQTDCSGDSRFRGLSDRHKAVVHDALLGVPVKRTASRYEYSTSAGQVWRVQVRAEFGGLPFNALLRYLIETRQVEVPEQPKPRIVDDLPSDALAFFDLHSRGLSDGAVQSFCGARNVADSRPAMYESMRGWDLDVLSDSHCLGLLYSIGAYERMAFTDQLTSYDDLGLRVAACVLGGQAVSA